ncbi:MAG: bifunctional (p)ppGpp synthetase/guanosine-3',5'-bis(diphosphate) 3'-pyrophosphohydrolase [Methylococcaceae bacterium]|nr:bifunctional (p)ppGpp synthetase/guanosine-3',5'-bis(diphosphate) 3'-pyrophosphohydrolase [Methylococcaceae bacterium]MCI0733997.1 bifunctional (p)ppGpp synthetase/guanosine-3',5'-bis(diphosphate) 3'-pyrophosphohydrolase [Methylococcaceae bacterium]
MSTNNPEAIQSIDPDAQSAPSADPLDVLRAGLSEPEFAPIVNALKIPIPGEGSVPARPRGIDVALILKPLGVDSATLTAAILSDSRFAATLDIKDIEAGYGAPVANLVRNVRWLNTFNVYSRDVIHNPNQAEILRRMLLAMVDDVRAVLIKLAYRVERLRKLSQEDDAIRHYIARETLELYSRLANRLGIRQLKWELEDLAFRYLNPQIYRKLADSLIESRSTREAYVNRFVAILGHRLEEENIDAEIYGRPKHIYSIWKKMQRKQVDFKDVYDLRAVRVIADKVSTCYSILGIIHGLWHYVPQEFDDYIANPKTNGYQSLHTVVVGPDGAMVEIQIRTAEMDQFAELGIAAHWRYKEGRNHDKTATKSIEALRRLLDNREDDQHLLDDFRTDLYTDRIFVLTPNGELKELPRGATPLDFAYSIHSEVGHRCRGAKVNQRIVPLTYLLQSGEQVEILTSRNGTPSRNWLDPHLGYLNTPGARSKVRHWFRKRDHERNLRDGKAILEKQRLLTGIPEVDKSALIRHFRLSGFDELLIAIGRADISPGQLKDALLPPGKNDDFLDITPVRKTAPSPAPARNDITVHGVDNLLTAIAQCCKPISGDPIIGFISGSKGIVVHRKSCRNIKELPSQKHNRLVEVDWGENPRAHAVEVLVRAIDRTGLLKDITHILANEQIHILEATSRSNSNHHTVTINLTLELIDTAQLDRTLERINQLPHIVAVARRD